MRWFVWKVGDDEDCYEDGDSRVDREQDSDVMCGITRVGLAHQKVAQQEGDTNTHCIEHLTDSSGSGPLMRGEPSGRDLNGS